MSDVEDDYLSDKFLAETVAQSLSKPLTYHERRRQAQRVADMKNAQNRKKSRRELEEESRREGLSKSLFERAKEDEQSGIGQANKAMAIMLKMGFKPGGSLGSIEEPPAVSSPGTPEPTAHVKPPGHLVEPLPLDVWSGRQGVGKRKRGASPTETGGPTKVPQQINETHEAYRKRAKQEYEERRTEGRLAAAIKSCITLDNMAEKGFNVYWLNPQDVETFPSDLLEALTSDPRAVEDLTAILHSSTYKDRLRQQMGLEASAPRSQLQDELVPPKSAEFEGHIPPHVLEDAKVFIHLDPQRRLELLLAYLREEHFYCFWCGTQYTDSEDLQRSCPGVNEEDHD